MKVHATPDGFHVGYLTVQAVSIDTIRIGNASATYEFKLASRKPQITRYTTQNGQYVRVPLKFVEDKK